MAFTVTPKAGIPGANPTVEHVGPSKAATTARERALKIMLGESINPPPHEAIAPSTEEPAQAAAPTQESPIGETNSHVNDSTDASAATPVPEAAKAPDEPLSAQYAQLARKEKALRAEALKLKSERDAWKREQSEQAMKAAPTQSQTTEQSFDRAQYIDKGLFARDPQRALAEAGLTYDQFTQALLASPTSPTEVAMQSTIAKLEAKLAALEETTTKTQKSFEERDQQSYQQALNQIELEAKSLVASDPEFEMIKATNSTKDVRDLIERTWKDEGRLMSVQEAATEVETYLTEEYLKLSTVGKIQKRLQPAPKQEEPKNPAMQSQAKTLTNAVAGTAKMSARQRALAVFNGEKI